MRAWSLARHEWSYGTILTKNQGGGFSSPPIGFRKYFPSSTDGFRRCYHLDIVRSLQVAHYLRPLDIARSLPIAHYLHSLIARLLRCADLCHSLDIARSLHHC